MSLPVCMNVRYTVEWTLKFQLIDIKIQMLIMRDYYDLNLYICFNLTNSNDT